MSEFLFTSESVSEGHPDKVADQISDAILDAILAQDPYARVAAETLTNTGLVVLAGEITTSANVDYIQVARNTIQRIGYDNTDYGIDYKGCAVLVAYDKQSPDIAQGVNKAYDDGLDQGAGDQGRACRRHGRSGRHDPVTHELVRKHHSDTRSSPQSAQQRIEHLQFGLPPLVRIGGASRDTFLQQRFPPAGTDPQHGHMAGRQADVTVLSRQK